jgi:hypothetical protein
MAASITLGGLMLQALNSLPVQEIFGRDPYESRRTALKGEKLLHVLVAYQMVRQPGIRGLIRVSEEQAPLQAAWGGPRARNTLANALTQRAVEQLVEAWMRVSASYGAGVERLGKKFARIALVDSSLLKLSLAVYDWAQYRQGSGAAKLHAALEWQRRIPQQSVVTAGKVPDANRAVQRQWQAGWPYVQDRGYVSFARLAHLRAEGAPFCRAPQARYAMAGPGPALGSAGAPGRGVSAWRSDGTAGRVAGDGVAPGELPTARLSLGGGGDRSLCPHGGQGCAAL